MADAARDQNFVPTLLGVSSADGTTPIKVYVDPVTHRLLVDIAGGSGTVTSVSVVTANGFAGTVADPTTTPAITLETTVTGIVKGNGTALSAASAGTDYVAPGAITTSGLTQGTNRLLGRTTAGTGAIEEISVGTGLTFAAGSLSASGVASSIVVGTTTITSGTTTRILYDNAGVLGEYTITGTGTVVAMQTAPTFVTSITTPSVLASSNDSGALGASGTAFSDLFLASGGVINWAAGDYTLTHSTGILTANKDLRITTVGTDATSVPTLNSTSSFQNKTITNSNNVLGGVTMTLGSDASYDMYYRSAGGVLTRLANGTTGQFLAATTGAAPSWGTPSSGSSFKTKFCTVFETAARFTLATSGGGNPSFDNSGVSLTTSGGSAKYQSVRLTNSAKFATWAGSPAFGTTFAFGNIATTGSAYFGIGAVTAATTGHTFTDSHIGFKVLISGGTASLYATQSGGTETASSALTTLVADDVIDLYLQVNSTTSVDYYWKKNGGSWSSATNLTTNMPTTTTAQGNQGSWSLSNDNTTGAFSCTVIQGSYER